MGFKNILNKFNFYKSSKNKTESDDSSYCYTNVIWNTIDNLIILISFSEDYFEQIIDIQDAINYTWQGLCGKIVYSSYDEEVTKKDENGNTTTNLIIHKKHYMLIGGNPLAWQELYMNINDLGNEILDKITNEIKHNCNPIYFKNLIDDGVFYDFHESENGEYPYNIPMETKSGTIYTNPTILISNLPNAFTGRDILKFIKIYSKDKSTGRNALGGIMDIRYMPNNLFKNHELYPLYSALFKDPTVEKLNMLLEPLYKQPDDDSIPGDVSDESLDAIFKEHYERFSAVADDSTEYEDIDEELADDEESENMREGDKLNDA